MVEKWTTCLIEYFEMSQAQVTAVLTVNVTVAVSNILINTFLIFALRKLKKHNNPSYRFISYLSMSDFSIGIIQLVIQCLPYVKDQMHLNIASVFIQFVLYLCAPFSAFMTMLIGLDRYLRMKYLNRYSSIMTHRRASILISLNFTINLIVTTMLAFASIIGFYSVFHKIITCVYLVVISTTFILYIRAYMSISQKIKELNRNQLLSNKKSDSHRDFAKGMMIVLVSLVICFIPNHVLLMMLNIMKSENMEPSGRFLYGTLWAIIVSYMNGTVNAAALILCNRTLRNYAVRLFRRGTVNPAQEPTSEAS